MGLWVEIRCDYRRPGCFSEQNNGPMGLVSEFGPRSGINVLLQQARKEGWQLTLNKLACPACWAQIKSNHE